ncbi:MAG: VCBS repeat-containing protein, partial [Candidatus Aegiribacteria sp.]|nr:VCBS repeat-containing protein [Candidatus Aegiribacteria sp.]
MKILSVLAIISAMLYAGESQQTDWSDGPGVTGPVTSWGSSFCSNIHTGWEDLPGSLLLAFNPVAHSITNYMGSIHFGYAADMDGDGDMDILSDSGYRALIAWFENDGSGGTWDRHDVSSYGEINYPRSCYPVDIDSDGDMDVLGTDCSSIYDGIYLWVNVDGSGTVWETYIIDDNSYSPHFVCSADIDGDGDPDVIACDFGPDAMITWYENNLPSIDWSKHHVAFIQDGEELFPVDMDLDGDIDILSACWGPPTVALWENANGTGTVWIEHEICMDIGLGSSVYAADIDGDDDLDVISTGTWDNCRISWFENIDGLDFSWIEHVLQYQFYGGAAVHAGDITGDGFIDILGAAGDKIYPPGLYELVLWESIDGSGDNWIRHSLDSGSWYKDVDVADIDGDVFPDVISFASVGSIIQWLRLGYFSSGQLISSILDMTGYPEWDYISWTSIEPPATSVIFQVRSSNDSENMGYWSDSIL